MESEITGFARNIQLQWVLGKYFNIFLVKKKKILVYRALGYIIVGRT